MQIQIQVWDVSQAETIIRFNRKCFLTDLWKPEDWRELLADPRAIYYGAVDTDTGALAGNLFIYNWQGEQIAAGFHRKKVQPFPPPESGCFLRAIFLKRPIVFGTKYLLFFSQII